MGKQKGGAGTLSRRALYLILAMLLMISMIPSSPVFASEADKSTTEIGGQTSLVDAGSPIPEKDTGLSLTPADSEPPIRAEDTEQGLVFVETATQNLESVRGLAKGPIETKETEFENSISGMVWLDMFDDFDNTIYAGDGIQQTEEQVLSKYSVSLFLASDTSNAVQTTMSDAGGIYVFENIEPGEYVVGVKTTTIGATEYLLPFWYLDGTTGDNRFVASYDAEANAYLYAYTESLTIGPDTVIIDANAGLRTSPQLQPMAVNWIVSGGTIPGTSYATLPLAVGAVNADTGTTYTITGGGGSESITSMLLVNTGKTITVDGGGAIVTQTSTRHFYVNGSLTLSDITLDGGSTSGGITVENSGTFIMNTGTTIQNCLSSTFGGGVYVNNYATFTMNGGTISGNVTSTYGGGGVSVRNNSAFIMNGGTISNNSVTDTLDTYGGGVLVELHSTFLMNEGTISNNSATYGGGVRSEDCIFTMDGGTISNNSATYGGGICAIIGAFDMNEGTIDNNTATNGGGVYIFVSNTFTMYGGTISDNSARSYGGGVYADISATFIMKEGTISNNNASNWGGGISLQNSTFIMEDGIIIKNSATNYGGGVFVNSSTFTMEDGVINDNNANYGAGLFTGTASPVIIDGGKVNGNIAAYSGGGIYNNGSTDFKVISGEINANSAANNGGGAYIAANRTFDITGGSISGNEANYGAGIFANTSSTITIDSGILDNNIAAYSGGGVYNNNATFTMSGATTKIIGNEADLGGGVYNDGTFNLQAGEISNNTATHQDYGGGGMLNGASFNMSGGTISDNTAQDGGGIYNVGTYNLQAGEISSNTALSDGGGIYNDPMEVGGYANLTVGAGVVFDKNTSRQAVLPPTNPLITYPNIQSPFSSIYTHPLNNHDISRTLIPVTIYYVDRSDNALGTPSSAIHYTGYGSPFTLAPTYIPAISDYAFADWKIGLSGALQGNTTVWVDTVVPLTDGIYLVYGRDLGTSGEVYDGITPTTPNNKEDFDVVRQWQMDDGSAISGLNDQIIIMDVGDLFTMAHDRGVTIPANLEYQGYYLSSDTTATLHVGVPNYLVNTTEGNVTITYVYTDAPQPQVLTIDKFVSDAGDADYDYMSRNKAKNRPVAIDEVFGWDIFSSLTEDLDTIDAQSYVVIDDLASYFDYEEASVKVYSVPAMETPVSSAYRLNESSDYTLDFNADTNTLAVSLTDAGMTLLGSRYTTDDDRFLMIKYDCKVNSTAQCGVSLFSGAEVEYIRDTISPRSMSLTDSAHSGAVVAPFAENIRLTAAGVFTAVVEEEPEVNTGRIEITKLADGTHELLVGAEFGIASSEADARANNFLATGSTDNKGHLTFHGLRFGVPGDGPGENSDNCAFWLVETKAPAGYKLLEGPTEIAFDSCQDEEGAYYFARVNVYNVLSSASGDTYVMMPKTADANNMSLYLGFMACSLVGALALLALLRRKDSSGGRTRL